MEAESGQIWPIITGQNLSLIIIYNYIENQDLLDVRDINTRRRGGILFAIDIIENYKARQDPMYRAMMAWNTLPVYIRNAETKIQLCGMLKNSIPNPYSKID